jgi:hypothetical protein
MRAAAALQDPQVEALRIVATAGPPAQRGDLPVDGLDRAVRYPVRAAGDRRIELARDTARDANQGPGPARGVGCPPPPDLLQPAMSRDTITSLLVDPAGPAPRAGERMSWMDQRVSSCQLQHTLHGTR